MLAGMPVSMQSSISNICNADRLPTLVGIVPENWLTPNRISFSAVMSPMQDGMVPLSWLPQSKSCCKTVIDPHVGGMVPTS